MDEKLKDVVGNLVKRLAAGDNMHDVAFDQVVKKGYTKESIKELLTDLDKMAEDEMPGASKSMLFWIGMAAGLDLAKVSVSKVVIQAKAVEVMNNMVVSRALIHQKIKGLKN